MKAIRLHDYGSTDALRYEDVPRPEPSDDQVLVRVEAAGVNDIDSLVLDGAFADFVDDSPPWIPGWDLSGVVESVGAAVDGYAVGDAVYGMTRMPGGGGTWAEYATVEPAEIHPTPVGRSHAETAGVPMVAMTAAHALFEEADVGSGDRVLVHGAAGGVGHVAVQLAGSAGATVAATAAGRDEAYLRQIGVDEFVDYREQAFESVLDPVDVVIDCVGGDVLERSATVVREGGTVVTLPEEPSAALSDRLHREHGIETRFFSVTSDADPDILGSIADHVESGTVEPTISRVYPLSEAPAAMERMETGHVRGKLVLDVPHPE